MAAIIAPAIDEAAATVERHVRVGFAVALAVLLIVAAVATRSTFRYIETAGLVAHTEEVLAALRSVEASMSRASSAQRGYLITGDYRYIENRDAARAVLLARLPELRELTSDNPEQRTNFAALKKQTERRLAVIDEMMVLQQQSGFESARSFMQTDEPLAASKAFNDAAARMESVESNLLRQRTISDEHSLRTMLWSLLALALLVALAFGLLLARIRREMNQKSALDEALRRSNLFLESIFENIPNMVFIKDARDLKFVRINRAGENLLGISRDDLLGKSDLDFFPPDQAEAFISKDRDTLQAGETVLIDREPIQTRTLGVRWLRTQKLSLEEGGEPAFLLGISEDITERKRIYEELEQSHELQMALNRELEAFSYSVAHDLRAPLRGIDGFSRALVEDYADKFDDAGKKYVAMLCESARRMGELIDDMLALAQVSRRTLSRQHVDIGALARDVVTRLQSADAERAVTVEIAADLSEDADPGLLNVVLENLLSNAWKFTQRTDAPRIEVGRVPGREPATYFVRDNGAGFDMAYAAKLFGVFQRLHGMSEFEGTGIGLATVQRVIVRHGGRIWAEGAVNEGAVFFFTLRSESGAPVPGA